MWQPLPACVGATELTLETASLTNHVDTSWPRKQTSYCWSSAQNAHTPGWSLIAEFCYFVCQLTGLTTEPCCFPVWLVLVGDLSFCHSLFYAGSRILMPPSLQILSLWTNAQEESHSPPLVLGQDCFVFSHVYEQCVCVSGLPTHKSISRILCPPHFTSSSLHSQAITEAL